MSTYIDIPVTGGSAGAFDPIIDGTIPGAGEIGELVTSTVAAASAVGVGATTVFGSVTSVTVGPGIWEIQGIAAFSRNGANLSAAVEAGISDSATGAGMGTFDSVVHPFLISDSVDPKIVTPRLMVNIVLATTYHLNTKFTYDAGSPEHYGEIRARRYR